MIRSLVTPSLPSRGFLQITRWTELPVLSRVEGGAVRLWRGGRGAFLALLLGVAACEPVDSAAVRVTRQPITGGAVDPADPEVFMLEYRVLGLPTMCSATLIGARTLVTAGHCTVPALSPGAAGTYRATNVTHARTAAAGDYLAVTEVRTHPAYGVSGTYDSANDIALALLATSPPGVTPKPWNRASMAGRVGAPLRVAGYGYTTEGDYTSWGTKNVVDLSVRAVSASFITLGDESARGFCNGDSGGPSFLTFADGVERLVGVHSNGPTCFSGDDVRIDAHAAFIDAWLTEHEPTTCATDGVCTPGCQPADPDCVCARDDVCNRLCPSLLDDPDCPRDCVANGVCATGRCPLADPDCVADGAACPGPLACRSRLCVADADRGAYCTSPCGGDADCPPGLVCDSVCRRPHAEPGADAGATQPHLQSAPVFSAADDMVSLPRTATCRSVPAGPGALLALAALRALRGRRPVRLVQWRG